MVAAQRLILQELHAQIAQVCVRAGRDPAEVTLIGASKTVPAERLRCFLEAGLTDVGENYVQEAIRKRERLAAIGCAEYSVRWHLIGALQSNKAREAVRYFDLIHSVDRVSLAEALDKAARAQDKVQEVLLQVNLGDEASKAGCSIAGLPRLMDACSALPNLAVRGLMCLPPYFDAAGKVRPYFRQLRELRDSFYTLVSSTQVRSPKSEVQSLSIGSTLSGDKNNDKDDKVVANWHLSMGMSHDFAVAIEEGATMVRIGTRLFGARR